MRRFPADGGLQHRACDHIIFLLQAPSALQRLRDVSGGELVVSTLRAHTADADATHMCCLLLAIMLDCGLASSIDFEAAASLAAAVLRAHPSDESVQRSASELDRKLLEYGSTSSPAYVFLPERAAIDRVAELKGRLDFESLVCDMDAFPDFEELQRAGSDAMDEILSDGGSHEDAVAAGAIECVVRALVLFPHSAETQRTSMVVLANLSFLDGANTHRVGSAGAVRHAIHTLRFFPDDTLLMCSAFGVLGNVSAEDQFRVEALNLGALALGVAALRRYFRTSFFLLRLTLTRYQRI